MQKAKLYELLKIAQSKESAPQDVKMTLMGIVQRGARYNYIYMDDQGMYWYEVMFFENGKFVTEYEHIFGHAKPYKGRKISA